MKFGPSSTDREAWLEARRHVVTATDAYKLLRGRYDTVRREKDSPSNWEGNRYTEHGRAREAVIMQEVEAEHGIRPNSRLVYGADERHAATPDGISDDGTLIAEVKTTKHGWDSIRSAPPEYYSQVQWQLHVTGAARCLFAWEVHDGFVPGWPEHEWVERDETHIGELVNAADRFLAGDARDEDPELELLIEEYARELERFETAQAFLEDAKTRIRKHVGDDPFEYKGAAGSVVLSRTKGRETFDRKRFEQDHPDLAREYVKVGAPGERFVVKPRKEEE